MPEGRGIYAVVIFLPSMLLYFFNIGIGFSTVHYMANASYKREIVFGNGLVFVLSHIVIALVVGFFCVLFFRDVLFQGVDSFYLFVALAIVPGQMMVSYLSMVILGTQKMGIYNLAQLFKPILTFVFIGIFLAVMGLGIKGTLLAEVVVTYGLSVYLLLTVIRVVGRPEFKIHRAYLKSAYSYGVKAYAGSLLWFLNTRMSLLIINAFFSPFLVGIYSVSYGLSEKLWLIPDAVATNLFPKISAEHGFKQKSLAPLVFRTTLLLLAVISILLWLISKPIILILFTDSFIDSAAIFRIMLVSVFFYGGWRIIESDLRGRGKSGVAMLPVLAGFLFCIPLNFYLIPKYSLVGAAWATVAGAFVTFVTGVIAYSRLSNVGGCSLFIFNEDDDALHRAIVINIFNRFSGSASVCLRR